jgi:hypothetical protein
MSEFDFWNMTLAELSRWFAAKRKATLLDMKQQAIMDYALADLIGQSMSRLYSSTGKMQKIEEAYSFIFTEEDTEAIRKKEEERKAELSALRFKQFADSFNKRFQTPKEEVAND